MKRLICAVGLLAVLTFATDAKADDDVLQNTGSVGGLTFGGGAFTAGDAAADIFGWTGVVGVVQYLLGGEEENLLADADILQVDPSSIGDLNFNG